MRAHGGLAFSIPIDIVFTKFDVLQPDVVYFLPENGEIATSPTRTGLTFNTRRLFEA